MYRTFKIPKGKNTSYSLRRLWYRFFPRRVRSGDVIEFSARILTEPYDIRPDKDQSDRHKLLVLNHRYFARTNKDASIISFQANPKANKWDLAPYFNHDFTWTDGAELSFASGELITGSIELLTLRKTKIAISNEAGQSVTAEHEWLFDFNWTAIALPWHGGKDNDGNGIGGVSPVDIDIKLSYRFV